MPMNDDELEYFHEVHRIIPEELKIVEIEDIWKVLTQISFAPSCVDMGWEFELQEVFQKVDMELDGKKWVEYHLDGYRFRTSFRRPDRETGQIGKGFGRWWMLPEETTESAVVKTAYAATRMILEHELMESFKWKKTRVFDPHSTVQELAQIAGSRYTASIP